MADIHKSFHTLIHAGSRGSFITSFFVSPGDGGSKVIDSRVAHRSTWAALGVQLG